MLKNIAAYLPAMAKKHPNQRAIVISKGRDSAGRMLHSHITYQELDRESNRLANGLLSSGFKEGERVALMVPPSFDLFIASFALFKAGLVPVFVDPGLGIKNLKSCLERAGAQHFIGIPKAHIARCLFGWNRGKWRKIITVGKYKIWGQGTLSSLIESSPSHELTVSLDSGDKTAAILFTSGSTGAPKGAVYSHTNFCAQVEALKARFEVQEGEIDLCTFPLFALFAPALGMTAVVPEMNFTKPGDVDPEKIFKGIETFGVQNMFGSPALLRRVAEAAALEEKSFPSLRRVISAGAPVPGEVIETLKKSLGKDCKIFTPYGATEALPVAIANMAETLKETGELTNKGAGVCVGEVVPGLELKIIKISDSPITKWSDELCLKQGEIGEIVVSGKQVTKSYFNNKEATSLAKIYDNGSRKIYHRMGDLGYFDKKGRLWFCGRKSHRVPIQEKTVYTVPGESIINTLPKVARSAIVGVGKGDRRRAVLCIESKSIQSPSNQGELREEIKTLCKKYPQTENIEEVLFHKKFPVDIRHNSKIFREKLAVWAEGNLQ